jgi:hypothetical protein
LTLFTADHGGFYLHGVPFYPLVQEEDDSLVDWSNACLIRLPARLKDDLNWSQESKRAEQVVAAGKRLFWELDLGLDSFLFMPEDSSSFYAFSLAVEEFSKQLWPLFQEHTFGVALYRGSLPSLQNFPSMHWENLFLEWTAEHKGDEVLYRAQMLAEYLHRLLSFLPETVLPFALIDVGQGVSLAKAAQVFSSARFEHVHLAIKGAEIPHSGICWRGGHPAKGWLGPTCPPLRSSSVPFLGVLLPSDSCLNSSLSEILQDLLHHLTEKEESFRVISEEKLTEQWNGLDELIVISKAVSIQGRRKLLGFIAAGGKVLTVGQSLNLPEEKLIGAEGFEPPTHCSQSSCASQTALCSD